MKKRTVTKITWDLRRCPLELSALQEREECPTQLTHFEAALLLRNAAGVSGGHIALTFRTLDPAEVKKYLEEKLGVPISEKPFLPEHRFFLKIEPKLGEGENFVDTAMDRCVDVILALGLPLYRGPEIGSFTEVEMNPEDWVGEGEHKYQQAVRRRKERKVARRHRQQARV